MTTQWKESSFDSLTAGENWRIDDARREGFTGYDVNGDPKVILNLADAYLAQPMHKNVHYVLISSAGYWGKGSTIAEATKQFQNVGGSRKQNPVIHTFTSDMPFSPNGRKPNEDEANCWVDNGDGTLYGLRCKRLPETQGGFKKLATD